MTGMALTGIHDGCLSRGPHNNELAKR
jgi:hypothetical protein